MNTRQTNISQHTRKLTTMAMLAAVAVVLVAAVRFPLIPSASFLEYDPADIPIFIGTFLYGPWAGLGLTVVVAVLQGVTVSAQSGIIGIIMHILSTGTFVVLAGLIYRKMHSRRGAVLALCMGTFAMTVIMCGCNLIFTPIFMGVPVSVVADMLLPAIIPFNLLKASINSIITFLVYKPISRVVLKEQ
jgi:riboflavin transporter FmnP